ncbi:MAG: RNA polymerase subunit sigma-70 [Brachymonas sp.]|nr:RNA polymerase subunit sigma-70 [Brachymonas sp.]
MNLGQHPELLDRIAVRYALGLVKGAAKRRLEAQSRQSAVVRARLLLWQERMHAMLELHTAGLSSSEAASAKTTQQLRNVWLRIENSLPSLPVANPQRQVNWQPMEQARHALDALRRRVHQWSAVAALASVAALAGWGLQWQAKDQLASNQIALAKAEQQLQQQAARQQVQYVAVLADDQFAATVLVTFDADKQRLILQRISNFQEEADKSLQLWAVYPGQAPLSLGLPDRNAEVRLTTAPGSIRDGAVLAMSLEPKGGAPAGSGPTGPILFKGQMLKPSL